MLLTQPPFLFPVLSFGEMPLRGMEVPGMQSNPSKQKRREWKDLWSEAPTRFGRLFSGKRTLEKPGPTHSGGTNRADASGADLVPNEGRMAANPQANSQYETNKLPGFNKEPFDGKPVHFFCCGSSPLLLHVATFSKMDGHSTRLIMAMIWVELTTLVVMLRNRHSTDFGFTDFTMFLCTI